VNVCGKCGCSIIDGDCGCPPKKKLEWTVAEPINLEEQVPPWSKYKREMNSRLVVACNGNGGCVLYAIGSCWEAWHEGSGSYRLDDNCLDDAPDGISIWEGRMHGWGPDRDGEYDAELRGEFRDLTEEEWKLLAKGEAPWNEKDWLINPAPHS